MINNLLGECLRATECQANPGLLADDICQIIFNTGGYPATWIGIAVDDAECSIKPIAYSGQAENYLSKVKVSWNEDDEHGQGPAGRAIRTGSPQIIANFLDSIDSMQPWWKSAMRTGLLSLVAIPFATKQGSKGVLAIYASTFSAFPEEDVAVLAQIARLLGEKLDF